MTIVCDLVGSNYAKRISGQAKGFFDLWSREQSDEVVYETLNLLGFGDIVSATVGAGKHRLWRTYNLLPAIDLPTSPLPLIAAHALFSKNNDMMSPVDREAVAWDSFVKSEESCRRVNSTISDRSFHRDPAIASILHVASRYICEVLGRCPELEDLDCDFGPGSSATDKKSVGTTARWKLSSTLTISNSAFSKFERLRACYPAWLGSKDPVPAIGLLEFVPKSAKTDRSIMIEPLLNTFVQKGIGSWMKSRLYRHGINLVDQSIQKERARVGSITGEYSTIDLSRASDSIAYMLVLELLPMDWFDLLDTWRTFMCRYNSQYVTLEKFSSMGNGFTFELETLIFKALIVGISAYCELPDDSNVYGDDITCNPDLGRAVNYFLPLFGFEVNTSKSFFSGGFREACGGDYRIGVDVRPWFCRGLRDGGRFSYQKVFSFHNFLQRKPWFDPSGTIRRYLLSQVPDKVKCWGPDGYGDIWLVSHAPLRTYLQHVHKKYPWREGFFCTGYLARPFRREDPCAGDNFIPGYFAGRGPIYDLYAVRAPKGARISSKRATVIVIDQGCDYPVTEELQDHLLVVD